MPAENLLYEEAGQLYCKVAAGVCNLKNGLFQSNFKSDLKKLLAIVGEALKYKPIIIEVFDKLSERTKQSDKKSKSKSNISVKECNDGSGCKDCWTKVQIYDMIFGMATSNTSGCPLISKMRMIKEITSEIMAREKVSSYEELKDKFQMKDVLNLPIYVRVNLCKTTMEELIDYIQNRKNFEYLDYNPEETKYNQFQSWVGDLTSNQFMKDYHMPDELLVFAPNTSFYNDAWLQQNKMVVQDKASCIPVPLLVPELGYDVIDACAAPGNKTSHLASYLYSQNDSAAGDGRYSRIFAFDRDTARCKILKKRTDEMINKQGNVSIEVKNVDFTKVDPNDGKFKNVRSILLDPSCSGSGMVRQIDRVVERHNNQRIDQERLNKLSSFQAMILNHALSFPSVNRVVYSTCSVTLDENESVVQEALDKYKNQFHLVDLWPENWMTRGKKGLRECIRTNPSYDMCNGFFVAVFERNINIVNETTGEVETKEFNPFIKRQKALHREDKASEKEMKKKYPKRRKRKNKIDKRNRPRPEEKYKSLESQQDMEVSDQPKESKKRKRSEESISVQAEEPKKKKSKDSKKFGEASSVEEKSKRKKKSKEIVIVEEENKDSKSVVEEEKSKKKKKKKDIKSVEEILVVEEKPKKKKKNIDIVIVEEETKDSKSVADEKKKKKDTKSIEEISVVKKEKSKKKKHDKKFKSEERSKKKKM